MFTHGWSAHDEAQPWGSDDFAPDLEADLADPDAPATVTAAARAALGPLDVLVVNHARSGLGRTSIGYVYHQVLAGGISVVILGFPAACIGAVLPLMIRAVSRSGAPLGTQVGALLTWNTLGAVVGTLGTGFVLMPRAGLRNAFGVLALALAMVALIAAWRSRWRGGMASAVAVCSTSRPILPYPTMRIRIERLHTLAYHDATKNTKLSS